MLTGPPKHPGSPNPKLSIKMKTTLGAPAPFGGFKAAAPITGNEGSTSTLDNQRSQSWWMPGGMLDCGRDLHD